MATAVAKFQRIDYAVNVAGKLVTLMMTHHRLGKFQRADTSYKAWRETTWVPQSPPPRSLTTSTVSTIAAVGYPRDLKSSRCSSKNLYLPTMGGWETEVLL